MFKCLFIDVSERIKKEEYVACQSSEKADAQKFTKEEHFS
jgi:hypothetical protein